MSANSKLILDCIFCTYTSFLTDEQKGSSHSPCSHQSQEYHPLASKLFDVLQLLLVELDIVGGEQARLAVVAS
jgi:hypothetical protein